MEPRLLNLRLLETPKDWPHHDLPEELEIKLLTMNIFAKGSSDVPMLEETIKFIKGYYDKALHEVDESERGEFIGCDDHSVC